MRKFIFSLVIFLTSVSAFAGVVTKSQAENVAKKYLGSSVEQLMGFTTDKRFGATETAFYVFNGEGKWVIVSAYDCASPILMHGEGELDIAKIPDNMLGYLQIVNDNILSAEKRGLAQSKEIKAQWGGLGIDTKGSSSPVEVLLETASWNQSSPFNDLCPEYQGYKCVTGCVATAMGILLEYYHWPQTGMGEIPAYQTDTYHIDVPAISLVGQQYDWTKMPKVYGQTATAEQNAEVAKLMKHLGAMVNMNYGPDGSSASSSAIIPALSKYMSFSASAKELMRCDYDNQDWFNMIKTEITLGRPVIYGGQNLYGTSGHQFICDGYNTDNEVHINWGWGGLYNSWFAVCYLGPVAGEGTGSVYSRDDSAIFGLIPDPEGDDSEDTEMGFYPYYEINGIALTEGKIAKNSEFTVSLTTLRNNGGFDFNGIIGIGLVDKNGDLKEDISQGYVGAALPPTSWYLPLSIGCKITSDIALGDRICAIYQPGSSINPNNWRIAGSSYSSYPNGIQVIGSIGAIDITVIKIPNATAGTVCYPSLELGQKVPSSVSWYVDGSALTKEYVKLTAGDHIFKAVITYTDNSTETIVKKVTVE